MHNAQHNKTIFNKNNGRMAFLKELILEPLRKQLEHKSKQYLAQKHRQMAVFAYDYISHSINLDGIYEKPYLDTFFDWMKSLNIDFSNTVALDIGGNIGNHSLYFSDFFKHVHAFEPNPRTYKVLSLNAELVNNVTCHNFGISDTTGTAVLDVHSINVGGSRITSAKLAKNAQKIDLRTLDSVKNLGDIKLIKIDVEGHEHQALLGAKNVIKKHNPIILFEQQLPDFVGEKSAVVDLLKTMGYHNFAVIHRAPRVVGSTLKKLILLPILRLIMGDRMEVKLTHTIKPDFYSFIIALPAWVKLPK